MVKLSVIVPTLDGSIPESLAAHIAEYRDVEVIVVKGVSPVGKARNLGLARATGDYIAWVDSDDEILPDYLKEITSILRLPPSPSSSSSPSTSTPTFDYSLPSLLILDYEMVSEDWHKEVVWHESGRGPLADLLSGRLSPECWRFIAKRELWEGLSFDETAEVAEDYRVMPRLLQKAKSYARVGLVYRYHVNPASLMHDFSPARARACLKAAEDRLVEFRGTSWEEDARADTIRWAGWLFESGQIRSDARRFLMRHLLDAWRCPRVNLWWKIKVPLLLLGFEPLLRRLYRFPKLRFWK